MMTVEEAIKKFKGKVKGIYLRSIRSGDIIEHYNDISEMREDTLSQATPGYTEAFGRVIVDIF